MSGGDKDNVVVHFEAGLIYAEVRKIKMPDLEDTEGPHPGLLLKEKGQITKNMHADFLAESRNTLHP